MFGSLLVIASVATQEGLKAIGLSDELNLTCVMGYTVYFEWNGTDVPLFVRQRPDAGVLQAGRIAAGDGGADANLIINSQSVAIGEWVQNATNGDFLVRG